MRLSGRDAILAQRIVSTIMMTPRVLIATTSQSTLDPRATPRAEMMSAPTASTGRASAATTPGSPVVTDEAVALPSPAVMLSARLSQYHGHLRRPPSPRPAHHRAGGVTTWQASFNVTHRSVAHPGNRGVRRWASTPPVSRRHRQPATGPPVRLPGSDLHRQATTSLRISHQRLT